VSVRFAGYAAVFDRVDSGGDVIRPGAFAETLARKGEIPLLWQHRAGAVIGRVEQIAEDRRGLRVIGAFDGSAEGRRAAALVSAGAGGDGLQALGDAVEACVAGTGAVAGWGLVSLVMLRRRTVTSPTCRASFGDAQCRVDLAGRSVRAVVLAVEGAAVTIDRAVEGRFLFGRLRWLSGANCGLSTVIWGCDGAVVRVRELAPHAITVGDRVELREGCDKTIATCGSRFANVPNFRGEPHVPGNDLLTRYPGA
jgi:hypothetical protein